MYCIFVQHIWTYWRSRKTLQTSESSVSFLPSLSMITKVSLITSRSFWSLKIWIPFSLVLWKHKIHLSIITAQYGKVRKVLTASPLFPAAPGGPTGPLEPWEKWVESTNLWGAFYSQVPLCSNFRRSHQIYICVCVYNMFLQCPLSFLDHPVNQQDLQGLEDHGNQSIPLDQDLLCHPGKAKQSVNKNKHDKRHEEIMYLPNTLCPRTPSLPGGPSDPAGPWRAYR